MRLELRPIGEGKIPSGQAKWFFEQGRRSLGRGPDCDWRLPEDHRSVSKLHCTIERDRNGFLLRDQSANGSRVDGVIVHEGETARLADQSQLTMGDLMFSVHISGEALLDVEDPAQNLAISDEPVTISAILADIAPGGRTAAGVLGDRAGDDWLVPVAQKNGGASPSRNVDIGWNGPPEIRPNGKILPDDWDLEEDNKRHSDYGSHLEHGSATHVAVPVTRPKAKAMPDVDEIIAVANAEPERTVPAVSGRSAELADRMEPLIRRMEEALEASFAIFDLEPPAPDTEPDFFGRSRQEMLIIRAEMVLNQQVRLQAALENLVHHTSQALEPRILEARVDAAAGRINLFRQREYWRAYRAQFEKNGRMLSVRELFSDAMTRTSTEDANQPAHARQPDARQKEEDDHEK